MVARKKCNNFRLLVDTDYDVLGGAPGGLIDHPGHEASVVCVSGAVAWPCRTMWVGERTTRCRRGTAHADSRKQVARRSGPATTTSVGSTMTARPTSWIACGVYWRR